MTPHFSFPMSLKNARTLGIRLDQTENERLHKFETETNIDAVALTRAGFANRADLLRRHRQHQFPSLHQQQTLL